MNSSKHTRTAVVTGASSGIGYGIAEAFLKQGANVVMNARNETKLVAAAKKLGAPERIAVVAGDIGSADTARRIVNTAKERFDGLDVLVNNAGIFASRPIAEYSESDLDGYLNFLKGTFLLTQAAVEPMRNCGGGAVINITTILAFRGVRSVPASAPMVGKGGIQALTQTLAIELAPDKIRVNAIAPGLIRTPIYGKSDEEFAELNGMQPLGRVGEVSDIVDAALYLAEAGFVTGVVLPVDGGIAAGGE